MSIEEEKLASIMRTAWPDADASAIEGWAYEIRSSSSVSGALEQLEQMDRDPNKDIKDLGAVSRSLRAAQKKLIKVGHEGGWALLNSSVQAHAPSAAPNAGRAIEALSRLLDEIATGVEEAARLVDPQAASTDAIFDSALTERRAPSRPKKTQASFVALECYDAFTDLSGREARVATDGGKAYGPFLDFVTSSFAALNIEASPETWARNAVRYRRKVKRPTDC
ncbi:MAG: hypothetical protein HOY44_10140 [Maritimibacter sp.]|uniref:hypothetical protein n=1 Tax=Maritimibacter sp. TaxID=2003363 RepID=UPI001DC6DBE6|nr:hypothetical protein [Maritimibacter sp.]MBL6427873.1 hypothetical protein [Maritimibacter sp.]